MPAAEEARFGVFSQVDERSGVTDSGAVAVGVEESQTCVARFVVIRLEATELATRPRCLNCSTEGSRLAFGDPTKMVGKGRLAASFGSIGEVVAHVTLQL